MRAAQARLGLVAAYLSLVQWGTVSATAPMATGADWLAFTLRAIWALRTLSSALGQAYIQYTRSLQAGASLGEIEGGNTVNQARKNFEDLLERINAIGSGSSPADAPEHDLDRQLKRTSEDNDKRLILDGTDLKRYLDELRRQYGADRAVTVDPYTWPVSWTPEQIASAYEDMLRREALKAQQDKARIHLQDDNLSHEQAIGRAQEAHKGSGSHGAGLTDWAVTNGSRDQIERVIRGDGRLVGLARGTGPNPCYFCAMLASRGFVYRSRGSAGFAPGEEISKWHNNCHCYPILRYTYSPAASRLQEFLMASWEPVTKDYSGKDKVRAWRRWLERERKSNPLFQSQP